jgi:hypothetical protein
MAAKKKARMGRPPGRTYPKRSVVLSTGDQLDRWRRAAEDMGIPLGTWMREGLDAYANDDPAVNPVARKHRLR